VSISFDEAIPIAAVGLLVNIASVLLLSGGGHHHNHRQGHGRPRDSQLLEFHRSGKLRILAVTSPARPVAARKIPTTAEEGQPVLTMKGSIGCLVERGPKDNYRANRTGSACCLSRKGVPAISD
jgi:Co/Zn/Cd efflux system component